MSFVIYSEEFNVRLLSNEFRMSFVKVGGFPFLSDKDNLLHCCVALA